MRRQQRALAGTRMAPGVHGPTATGAPGPSASGQAASPLAILAEALVLEADVACAQDEWRCGPLPQAQHRRLSSPQ
jgi:hypothetical protein